MCRAAQLCCQSASSYFVAVPQLPGPSNEISIYPPPFTHALRHGSVGFLKIYNTTLIVILRDGKTAVMMTRNTDYDDGDDATTVMMIIVVIATAFVGALVLLWITHKVVRAVAWLWNVLIKITVYGSVWVLLAALACYWISTIVVVTDQHRAQGDMSSGSGGNGDDGDGTNKDIPSWATQHSTGSEDNKAAPHPLLNTIIFMRSLWNGDIGPPTGGSLVRGLAWGTYRAANAAAGFALKRVADRVVPLVYAIVNDLWDDSKWRQSRGPEEGDEDMTCGTPCAVSGTDCPDDAPCLCNWADRRRGATGQGYSTVWRACREYDTFKMVGRCVCPRSAKSSS